MENLQHFVDFWLSWNCFAWVLISSVVTGILSIATGLHGNQYGWKSGVVCGIAFTFGALATHFPLF